MESPNASARRSKIAVATTSQLAADAAAEIADLGGNAVDCGIAAAMCSINTQPGVCALAGSAYVTIWQDGQKPVTIDGNVAIPGKGFRERLTDAVEAIQLDYGGGITTLVGPSSVAVPGTPAALHLAAEQYGVIPWRELLRPSIRAAQEGFPLAAACHHYLSYAGNPIFSRSVDGHRALHDENGDLRPAGSRILLPDLATTLEHMADEGPDVFYHGEIGQQMVAHVRNNGGFLTTEDLATYSAEIRESLCVDVGAWRIATNPSPAIGGACLAAMLLAFGTNDIAGWCPATLRHLAATQQAVLSYRKNELDSAADIATPIRELLEHARSSALMSRWASGSTVHTSAVDGNHLACSVTASSGYGSGDMPAGTGLWLNNCLGELELNCQGLSAAPPGKRLPSNMAPTVARAGNAMLAVGSPGADRITTALHQFFVNFVQIHLDLDNAVAHPRMHLSIDGTNRNLAIEPGIEMPADDFEITRYKEKSMYFGGVAAALVDAKGHFQVAADSRREGGTFIAGCQ